MVDSVAFEPMPAAAAALPRLSEGPTIAARQLARSLEMTPTIAEWLLRRGMDGSDATARFLTPRLADLTPPDAMVDRAVAADRLAAAIRRRERIAVFGDYDCDGMTSTAIVTETIRALSGDAVPLCASRFDGGYGVSATAVKRILETGAKVLVTCDCGSSDHESLGTLRAKGLDVIVIDHHLVPSEPLPALAFLNPHRPDCGFSYKGLASCGLALSVAAAIRATLGAKLDLRQWLDLVAIGTIADVAPLDGDNRALVRAGLASLRRAPRPGLRALFEVAKIDGLAPLTGEDVAFRIAPRLNAPGRLGPPDRALDLLLARSDETARALAAEIEQISAQRRAQQEQILEQAIAEIERERWDDRPAIVVGREGWNSGVVGIVAGRLATRFSRPVVVVGFDGVVGRGSVRGPAGARLHDAISAVSECLERFGGHQAAAGLEVRRERLEELRVRFEHEFERRATRDAEPDDADVIALYPADQPAQVVADLERLEPCGQGNPAPRLLIEGSVESAREVKGGHLKLEVSLGGRGTVISAFGIGMGARSDLSGPVRLLGRLRRDTWRGGDAVELRLEAVVS